jgi:glyoxylase-like metal-dependent hydrolase (beta-lactamase superfamily II)
MPRIGVRGEAAATILPMATEYPVLRWRVGDVAIARVVEIEGTSPGSFFFAEATPEKLLQHAWLKPSFLGEDGRVRAAIHCFVIESQGRTIVVDTCVGNDKPRDVKAWHLRQGPFLKDLAEAGYPREKVDTVLCTHLHVDHVGWNTMLVGGRWVPTFPKARYLFGRKEWEHFAGEPAGPDREARNDSVRPVLGQADLVESDHRITSEVFLEPTPGHTPGHVSVRIVSRGVEAVITGDLMHHPVQCAEVSWASRFDVDPEAARRTRRSFLERYADRAVLVLGTHFAAPTGGRVVREGAAFRFEADRSAG